jgi:hypothetical protein
MENVKRLVTDETTLYLFLEHSQYFDLYLRNEQLYGKLQLLCRIRGCDENSKYSTCTPGSKHSANAVQSYNLL